MINPPMCPRCDIELVNEEVIDAKKMLKCGRCGAYYEDCRSKTMDPLEW